MQRDYLDNPLSGQRDSTLRAINDFIEGYLAYETRAERILSAADADPDSCAANVYAGLLWMLLEAPQAAVHAAKYLSAAERAAPAATRREQINTAILRAWADDDLERSIRLCDQASDEFPRDLAIVKLHQYFEFNRGNSPQMLRAAVKVGAVNADVPYIYGMKAFGYEQCHLLDEAESEARAALAMRRKEPWAQHALAHVFLTRGRIDEGAQFLEDSADTWSGLNSFMLTHIWWHLALFYLSQGRDAEALKLYDAHCWGIAKDYSQDQVGAVSLLARLEIAGVAVGSRWQDLAHHLAARAEDTVQPFLTLQYLYGLARAQRPQAEVLLESVRRHAQTAPHFNRSVWREVALPALRGLVCLCTRRIRPRLAALERRAAAHGRGGRQPRAARSIRASAAGRGAQERPFDRRTTSAGIAAQRRPLRRAGKLRAGCGVWQTRIGISGRTGAQPGGTYPRPSCRETTMSRDPLGILFESIDARREEMVDLARSLIRFPTINPPGEAYRPCAEFIGRRLSARGFSVAYVRAAGTPGDSERYPRINVIARRDGAASGPCVHFNSHIDVVQTGAGWTMDPFAAQVVDGKIFGRGACDMKGGLAASIIAVEALIDSNAALPGALEISGTVDEESGGYGGVHYLAERGWFSQPRVDHVIIPEPLNVDRVCIGHRGVWWAEIETHGRMAHGSMPFLGDCAVRHMNAFIDRLERDLYPKLAARRTDMPVVPSGARHSTLNINSIHGGHAESSGYPAPCVPDSCRMVIDRRLLIEENMDSVKGEVRELLEQLAEERAGFAYEIRDIFQVQPTMADRNGPVARSTAAAVRRVLGRDAEFICSPGTYDQKHIDRVGKLRDCIAYGPGILDLAHQPDEYVLIDDMLDSAKVMAMAARSLLLGGA